MKRYEITATVGLGEAINYRFTDYADSQSFEAGSTEKAAIEKTFNFINRSYLPFIRKAGRTNYLSNGELAGALKNIAGWGRQIYREFVPAALRESVHDLEDGSILTFVSDNVGIPWELVYNDVDFWGRRFIIHKVKKNYKSKYPKTPLLYKKILNIVGATVETEAKEMALHLFDQAEAKIKRNGGQVKTIDGRKIDSINDVFSEISEADLIHITCHGEISDSEGLYLQIVKDPEPYLNLMPATIGVLDIYPGCFVFANACVSAGAQPGINETIRFGTEFCSNEKGGGAFIGTLDLIPDVPALEFAKCFYYNFLFNGVSVGESLRLAKREQLGSGELKYGLFPLVYSLYGNPNIQGKL